MFVLDPAVLSVAWPVVLGAAFAVCAWLSKSPPPTLGSSTKPQKLHSLGTKIPFIGDVLEVVKNAHVCHDWLSIQSARFNYEPWAINIPGTPAVIVVTDPSAVEAIMTTQFNNFVKGPLHTDILHDLFGDGLVVTDGDQWYHQRKTAAKFFSTKTLRVCMMKTMQRNMRQVYTALDAQSANGQFVDIALVFHQFTLQSFVEVGVGIEFPLIGRTDPHPFEKAIDTAVPLISRRRLLPPFVWKLRRWLNIGPEKALKDAMVVVHGYINDMISQSLQDIGGNAIHSDTVEDPTTIRSAVSLFVEHSNEDKAGLRPRDIVDFVLNFVVAARDTSSMTIQWFFYAVGTNPRVEDLIRKEFTEKLPALGVGPDGYITADHVKQLVYLDATIMETLRLYPAGPFLMRQAVDDTILNGDVFIRKHQEVAISIYAMARNQNVWGPDASEFMPERWIDPKTGQLIPISGTKFFSFSTGPRACIGMKLAMLNLRVVTANLMHRYKFEIDPNNDGSYLNAATLIMKHELLAKVHRLK